MGDIDIYESSILIYFYQNRVAREHSDRIATQN